MTGGAARLLNVGLRLATLGTRFMFVFFLARYLAPASVGQYGLFTVAVGYAIYFVGLDFYVYGTREIIAAPAEHRGKLIKSQILLASLLYMALLPVMLLLLNWSGWPAWLIWWFFPILVLDHVNQEIYRLLIALSRQAVASLLLFIRQGSWAIVAVVLMTFFPDSRRLDAIIALWAGAGVVAVGFGVLVVLQAGMGGWRMPIDRRWIHTGIRISSAFLIATLALRGIQTMDRYWVEALGGIEVAGAYVLFFGVASALMVFLDAGVFAFAYPDLLRLAQTGSHDAIRRRLRQMVLQILAASVIFWGVSSLLLPLLLDWVGHPLYQEHVGVYSWLLAATVINALGLVPHYALYAYRHDRPVIASHLLAIPAFVLSVWLLSPSLVVSAVPAGLCLSFLLILILKSLAWCRLDRNAFTPARPASSP